MPPLPARIRAQAPLTVAAFMELALYDEDEGYYARAEQRSGRAGDFFTSVDVGSLFGELLSTLVARAWHALGAPTDPGAFMCCEAGAATGRLARDLLAGLASHAPDAFPHVHLALVERSARARAAPRDVLGPFADRLRWSGDALPDAFDGVIIANELLDALPVHRVQMTPGGLCELYVTVAGDDLALRPGPLSDHPAGLYPSRVHAYLARTGIFDLWRTPVRHGLRGRQR